MHEQALVYWISYAFFACATQYLLDPVFGHAPAYSVLKFAGIVWMFHAKSNGANFVYRRLIRNVLVRNKEKIVHFVVGANEKTRKIEEDVPRMILKESVGVC
jgi:hypothetical protein